jgi:hypothetical protein
MIIQWYTLVKTRFKTRGLGIRGGEWPRGSNDIHKCFQLYWGFWFCSGITSREQEMIAIAKIICYL